MKLKSKTTSETDGEFRLLIPNFEHTGESNANRRKGHRTESRNRRVSNRSAANDTCQPPENRRDRLENMIITCSNSVKSLDEITLGEEFDQIGGTLPPAGQDIHVDLSDRFESTGSRNSPRRTISATVCPSSAPIRVSPRRSSSLNSAVQTDATTGERFIWKKGANERFVKVPIHGLSTTQDGNVYEGSSASTQSCTVDQSVEPDLERLEEKLVAEALTLSVVESIAEDEMIELALSLSLQDQSADCSPAPDSIEASKSDFSRKKHDHNNVCPFTLEKVNEGEEYGFAT